jgi:hypothetical protein
MPDRMPNRMSEYMSDRMPERMRDRMSKYTSDRMSVGEDHLKKEILVSCGFITTEDLD